MEILLSILFVTWAVLLTVVLGCLAVMMLKDLWRGF